ncbi:MAG: hypothetical protein NTX52_14720 [Planctomycetota bacterium]|nr:hypothetical protein [Planctomycetota bacterium]
MIRRMANQPLLLYLTALFFVSINIILPQSMALAAVEKLDQNRIEDIAALLAEKPKGFGSTITDRDSWGKLARNDSFKKVTSEAENLLQEPIPDQPDDLYLDFSRTGNRTRWEKVSGLRRGRVRTLVLAECLENKRRFIPAFEELVRALCSERTWVMPAHDAKLTNFNGTSIDIDLGSSTLAWSLATADYLLADKISPEVRQLIRNNLDRRIFAPYQDMVLGKREQNWWMTGTNNWNAVCLAGVTGPALAVIDSPRSRAFFIVAAEKYSENFLEGFTDDGYCSEGLGYWNYGFGYYIMLSEMIYQATNSKVDLLQNRKAKQAATFGVNIEILNGVYPAFADCSIDAKPASQLMFFVSRRFGLGLHSGVSHPVDWEQIDPASASSALYQSMMYSFPNSASRTQPAQGVPQGPGIRSWFEQGGVLISRPGRDSSLRLAVALKKAAITKNIITTTMSAPSLWCWTINPCCSIPAQKSIPPAHSAVAGMKATFSIPSAILSLLSLVSCSKLEARPVAAWSVRALPIALTPWSWIFLPPMMCRNSKSSNVNLSIPVRVAVL